MTTVNGKVKQTSEECRIGSSGHNDDRLRRKVGHTSERSVRLPSCQRQQFYSIVSADSRQPPTEITAGPRRLLLGELRRLCRQRLL